MSKFTQQVSSGSGTPEPHVTRILVERQRLDRDRSQRSVHDGQRRRKGGLRAPASSPRSVGSSSSLTASLLGLPTPCSSPSLLESQVFLVDLCGSSHMKAGLVCLVQSHGPGPCQYLIHFSQDLWDQLSINWSFVAQMQPQG